MIKQLAFIAFLLFNLFDISGQKIGGITVVAPPEKVDQSAFDRVVATNANWISLVPYGYHKKNETDVRYNLNWQWWGERKDGIVDCIKHAKSVGLKIMLKPQVYIPGSWVGDMDFKDEEQWQKWEASYSEFINYFLDIAIEHNVDMICIGTEYKISIVKREKFWRDLISSARLKFKGQIVYSSNWDNYDNVPFWDLLDYIGISGYFPLSDVTTPKIAHLKRKWVPIVNKLETYSKDVSKRILFTEYGYLTIDKCAYRAWELEKVIKNSSINQNAQANAFAALYSSFVDKSWWAGGFIWKWFPDGMGHEGYPEKDYDPQDKKAEEVIKVFYKQMQE